MGRNKNKANRSAARQRSVLQAGGGRSGGAGGGGGGLSKAPKRDPALPAFFKQRKQQQQAADAVASRNVSSLGSDLLASVQQDDVDQAQSVASSSSAWDGFVRSSHDLALHGKRDSSAKAFMRDVKQVIENSDVLLQVLDARDPMGSRSRQTERMAMAHGKRMVLILNKVDLIPMANLQAWLRYLRHDFPTLAFKASTQQQRTNLKQGRGNVDLPASVVGPQPGPQQRANGQAQPQQRLQHGAEAIGANALLQLLKNYARTAVKGSQVKQQITVGVVGPPNVGKSSLINSLLRTRACAVASTPGWTKVVQGVMLEKSIRILDCPGVVLGGSGFEEEEGGTEQSGELSSEAKDQAAWSVLRNTVKVELIEDPIAPIVAMMRRVDAEQLSKLYSIEGGFNEGDAHDFLLRVALMRGKLGKGGIPDLEGAARIVLHDWNVGRIAFHSEPPAVHPSLRKQQKADGDDAMAIADSTSTTEQAADNGDALTMGTSLVSGFGEAFDLAALLGEADAEAMGLHTQSDSQAGRGKDLIVARERVYATDADPAAGEAIEEDQEEDAVEPAITTADQSRSTLGKRRRAFDALDSSDEEEEEAEDDDPNSDLDDPSVHVGRPVQWLAQEDSQNRGRSPISRDALLDLDALPPGTSAKREPVMSRQQRHLQRAMGTVEVERMAPRRGDLRKAQKKNLKRLRRSGAGLVDALNSGLALQEEEEEEEHTSPRGKTNGHGMFAVLEPTVAATVEEEEEEEL